MEKIIKQFIGAVSTVLIATLTLSGLSSCSNVSLPQIMPSFSSSTASSTPVYNPNTPIWEGQPAIIWDKLQHISVATLKKMKNTANTPEELGWVELAIISKQRNTSQLVNELISWRSRFPSHPANQLLPSNATLQQLATMPSPRQIAILLPQKGTYSSAGQAVREGFLKAYYANLSHGGSKNVKFYDTTQSPSIQAVYQKALAEGADFVVGPLIKNEVQQLSQTGAFTYPTLALNYTEINNSLPQNFYEFGLLPEDEASQIANSARNAGLSKALIIAPQNAWGKRLVNAIHNRWQALGGSVQDTLYYSSPGNYNSEIAGLLKIDTQADKKLMEDSNDKTLLEQQRRQDFDVIFLLAQPQNARLIVPLLRYYYVGKTPIYATSAVYAGSPNPTRDADLNGVIVCDIPWRAQSNDGNEAVHSDRLYAVGQDAYLLTQTLQRLIMLPQFPLYSMTGALTISPQHKIHRRLPCTPIRNGLIK